MERTGPDQGLREFPDELRERVARMGPEAGNEPAGPRVRSLMSPTSSASTGERCAPGAAGGDRPRTAPWNVDGRRRRIARPGQENARLRRWNEICRNAEGDRASRASERADRPSRVLRRQGPPRALCGGEDRCTGDRPSSRADGVRRNHRDNHAAFREGVPGTGAPITGIG